MSGDDFTPHLGKPRATKLRASFRNQLLRAVSRAGGLAGARRRGFTGSRIGRGGSAARVMRDRYAGASLRRVMIKTRIVKLGAKGRAGVMAHVRYLQRDGVSREGMAGRLYDAGSDEADAKAFVERGADNRHQFRLIVAPEDGAEYDELKGFTRRLMTQVEKDLETRLEWVAVDHHNTGHPHTHVIIRGKDERGRDLIIARDYIAQGMRTRAQAIVSLDLGPRTDHEIEQRLMREVDLSAELEPTLRRMGERGDIIRTMQQAMTAKKLERAGSDYAVHDPSRRLVGRVIERGLSDELQERHYLIVDGIDGRTHYAEIGRSLQAHIREQGSTSILVAAHRQLLDIALAIENHSAASCARDFQRPAKPYTALTQLVDPARRMTLITLTPVTTSSKSCFRRVSEPRVPLTLGLKRAGRTVSEKADQAMAGSRARQTTG